MKSLLKKIKLKTELIITKFFIAVSLRLNWPWLTAVIFSLETKNVNKKGEKVVLCMRRSIFMDDVRAMAEFSGRVHYLVLGRENLFQILIYFVGKAEMKKITQYNYHTENYGQIGKEKYYQYLKKVWPIFKKFKKFDAVLYSNFCYTEEQGLARACGDLGIPLVVLFKEGMVTPGAHLLWAQKAHEGFHYGKQAKMLIYNQHILKALAAATIPGLTEDDMEPVGIPRMDHYFKKEPRQNAQKQVTLFSAFFHDKLSFLLADDQERYQGLTKKLDDFHRLVMQFALEHPNYKVIIKTKMFQTFFQYVLDIYNKNFKEKISNLEIVNHGDPVEMIKNSDVVIGFGSTTLIEALAADKTIISFDFADLLSNNSFDYFRGYPGLINYARTKEDLEEVILNYEKYGQRDPQARLKFLEEFLYIPDGRASIRAEEAIIRTVENYSK